MKRDFKGIWIPAEIWLNKDLTMQEKLFLVEIDSLDNSDGCFASNGYFEEFFGLSKQRCSQIVNGLKDKKVIEIDYIHNGNEVKKRVIRVSNIFNRVSNFVDEGIKYMRKGYQENAKDNNTINNTNNNIKEICPKLIFGEFENVLLSEEELHKLKEKFVDYEMKIENLSSYLKSTGKNKYKSHYATILNWARKDPQSSKPKEMSYADKMTSIYGSNWQEVQRASG